MLGDTLEPAPHDDTREQILGDQSAIRMKLGGVEVGQADFDPACGVAGRAEAKAVAVSDVTNGPRKPFARLWQGASQGSARAAPAANNTSAPAAAPRRS